MSAQDSVTPCSDHRDSDAGWRCNGCRKYLCGECTAQLINLYYCAHCDALATQLTEPRDGKPFLTWVTDAVTYPLTTFLVTAAVIAPTVILSLIEEDIFGARAAQVAVLAIAGLLTVVHAARRGPDGRAKMLGKAVATTALLWVPVAAYVVLGNRSLNDELGILVGGLAAVYVPAVIATSATDAPIVHGLNPFAVFDWVWKIKLRYTAFVLWTFIFGGIAVKLSTTRLEVAGDATVDDATTTALAVLFMLMACRMLGTLVHVHGYAFGWGPPEHYVDPLVSGLKASAGRKGRYGVGDPDAGDGAQALSLVDEEQAAAREIRRHLAKDEFVQALALHKKRESWSADTFNPKSLLDLGVAAAKAKDHDLALSLLTRVTETDGPFAPRALFRLARLYETLEKPEQALTLYRKVVDTHPGSDVARPSKQRLSELTGGE